MPHTRVGWPSLHRLCPTLCGGGPDLGTLQPEWSQPWGKVAKATLQTGSQDHNGWSDIMEQKKRKIETGSAQLTHGMINVVGLCANIQHWRHNREQRGGGSSRDWAKNNLESQLCALVATSFGNGNTIEQDVRTCHKQGIQGHSNLQPLALPQKRKMIILSASGPHLRVCQKHHYDDRGLSCSSVTDAL